MKPRPLNSFAHGQALNVYFSHKSLEHNHNYIHFLLLGEVETVKGVVSPYKSVDIILLDFWVFIILSDF